MELQRVCQGIVGESPGVMACLLVDLETGLTLADERRPGVDVEVEWLARSASLLFRGGLMNQFASALSPPRSLAEYMKEAQITTATSRQFLSVLPGRTDTVLVLVTERSMSIGLGWMTVHQSETRFDDPGGTRAQAARSEAATPATHVRAGPAPERPRPPAPVAPPRAEPRVAAPAPAGTVGSPRPGTVVTGLRGRRLVVQQKEEPVARNVRDVQEKAESDSRKEPAEASKPVTRVGARAFFRQKT